MDFEKLDLTELDKDLSEEQRKEWNAIYASYRSGSILNRLEPAFFPSQP